MNIYKNNDTVIALAEEGKAFKIVNTIFVGEEAQERSEYKTSVRVETEAEANALEEVYYRNGREITETDNVRLQRLSELKEIREWFADTDYIPNKVIVGEWDKEDERFVRYCAERAVKRARQDELHRLLGYAFGKSEV